MSGGEDWLLRPVLRQALPYAELHGTVISLHDIALLNEALDVQDENQARISEALKDK